MRVLKDSGSEISKSFFDDSGKFDADKFLKNIETFGKPMNQLTMQMESYKRQILESMKYEKESIESKRKLAKETLEQAQANKKAADEAEKTAKIFEKLGIKTVGDLIRFYPRDYEKFEEVVPVSEIKKGEING